MTVVSRYAMRFEEAEAELAEQQGGSFESFRNKNVICYFTMVSK